MSNRVQKIITDSINPNPGLMKLSIKKSKATETRPFLLINILTLFNFLIEWYI